MGNEVVLNTPVSEEQVRELRLGDTVYVTGAVHTMRDMGHRRSADMLRAGKGLPFDLSGGVLWHCGPVVARQGDGWRVVSAGSTTSSRLSDIGAELIRSLGIRAVAGKGTMTRRAVEAMKEKGCCYLCSIGGCALLYARSIDRVREVHWLDLGMPEATWVFEVVKLGPFVVGIDAHGNSFYESLEKDMKAKLVEAYRKLGIKSGRSYSLLPKRVPGKA